MVPPPSNPDQPSEASNLTGLQTEQMFRLIDSILPFEACLYHQFLPLALEGRHLRLGMVTPQDSAALNYARHILAYLRCSLKTEQISAQTHQSLLSAYLNYTRTSPHKPEAKADEAIAKPSPTAQTPDESSGQEPSTPLDSTATSTASPLQLPTLANAVSQENQPPSREHSTSHRSKSEAVTPLELQALYLARPIEFVATLAPPQLLQELLSRVLIRGISRLYFERQPEQGRILWSKEGVLQSVMVGLSVSVFQGIIIELKRLLDLRVLPATHPQQVEVERRYHQEDLLLRLRVVSGTYGEEVTLQILRGVALKVYQRQQLERLSQEALKLAQQLQHKVSEMRDRASRYPTPVEALPALSQLLRGLDQQLEAIAESPSPQHDPPVEERNL